MMVIINTTINKSNQYERPFMFSHNQKLAWKKGQWCQYKWCEYAFFVPIDRYLNNENYKKKLHIFLHKIQFIGYICWVSSMQWVITQRFWLGFPIPDQILSLALYTGHNKKCLRRLWPQQLGTRLKFKQIKRFNL